jgi:hypothetical protein
MSRLQERLTRQLASRGVKGAKQMADALLEKRGHLKNGELTAEGKKRQALGNDGRAKDRAIKLHGGKPSDYVYNAKTNRVKKKK